MCSAGVCQLFLLLHGGYNWGTANSLSPLPTVGNNCKWKTFLQEKATGLKWTGWILLPRKLLSGRRWQILPTLGLKLRCPSGCFWLPRFPNDPTQPIPPSESDPRWVWAWAFWLCGQISSPLVTNDYYANLPKSACMHFFGCMANSGQELCPTRRVKQCSRT